MRYKALSGLQTIYDDDMNTFSKEEGRRPRMFVERQAGRTIFHFTSLRKRYLLACFLPFFWLVHVTYFTSIPSLIGVTHSDTF